MKPIHFAFAFCLLGAACASPAPEAEVSSAATPDLAATACADDGVGCVTPMTRADAVAGSRRNGLGEAAFRWVVRFW